jgi:pimeloyl-ACP methyl ester carboxylesterase
MSPLKLLLVFLLLGPLAGCGQSQTPEQQSADQQPQESQQAEQLPATQSSEPVTTDEIAESEQATQAQWQPESAARALLAIIIAGQYEKAAENFTAEVAAGLPADKLKTTVETLQKQVGRYQSVADEAKVQEIQSNQVVDLLCSFEVMKLVFRVSYDEQQQVAGIFFLPAPAEPSPVDKNAPPDVQLETKDTTLYGTIDLPKGDGPFPMVLIISGSGPNDRDGNQAALKSDYLKKLSAGLTEQGFAVLRYDKRGSGKSGVGDAPLETFRFDVFVDDAVGWVSMLRKDKRFSSVAILGHSQGSLVAMLAGQRVPVDAIVSIAGSGRSIDKVLITQLGEQLKSMPELRAHAFAVIEELAAGQTVQDYPEELEALFKPSIQGFLVSWMQHDPVKVIATLEIPILIVQGTRDIQILVEDAEALKKGQAAAELVLVKNMNHVLRHIATETEQLPSYGNPELPLDPQLAPAVTTFLKKALANP